MIVVMVHNYRKMKERKEGRKEGRKKQRKKERKRERKGKREFPCGLVGKEPSWYP